MPGKPRSVTLRGLDKDLTVPGWAYEGDGSFGFQVVGESNYQKALWEIVGEGRRGADNNRVELDVIILPEPDNRYDPNAMRVFANGHLVGYLSKEDAGDITEELELLPDSPLVVTCRGLITGGFQKRDGSIAHLGISLDLDFPLDDFPLDD